MQLVKKSLSSVALAFVLVELIFGGTASFAAQVDVSASPSEKVAESLYFPDSAINFAKNELKIQKKYAQNFLDGQRKHANSLKIVASTNRFAHADVASYSKLAGFLPDWIVSGSGDWGHTSSAKKFAPSLSQDPANHLVTLSIGNCRLSWSLFNSDTWFEPDCKVVVATPRQYLQAALIDYNEHAQPQSPEGYFIEVESLNAIAGSKSQYQIKDGAIFSPSLDPMLQYTGLVLRFRSANGESGYDIQIDPTNKWHFTFSVAPPVNQLRASWARVVTNDGPAHLTFDRPLY